MITKPELQSIILSNLRNPPIKASCFYCHKEFALNHRLQRWHNCKRAIKARMAISRTLTNAWKEAHGVMVGKYKLRKKATNYKSQNYHKKAKQEKHFARCGHESPNHFYCSDCLTRKVRNTAWTDNACGYPISSAWM
jgi:hypothetical protein